MTDISEAVDRQDITQALTPGQLVLLVIGIFVLLRIIRALRH
jgi:hypothetical protein